MQAKPDMHAFACFRDPCDRFSPLRATASLRLDSKTAQQSWLDQASGRRGKLTLTAYISLLSTLFPSAAHDAAASHFFFAAAFAFFLLPPLAFALPFLPLLLCNSCNFASSSSTLSSSSSSATSLCCADDVHACALGQTSGFDANWSTSELRPNIARHG